MRIPSPWEQSRRHEWVLAKVLETLGITGRIDKQLSFHHVVMMHPKAVIKRPDPKAFDTSFLIKADQFPTWHGKFTDKFGAGAVFKALLNIRSLDTVVEWGEKLVRQHRAQDLLALPDFMKPKAVTVSPRTVIRRPAVAVPAPVPVAVTAPVVAPVTTPAEAKEGPARKLICAHCGVKISYPEGKFCRNNSKRFNGLQYCRDHQGLF